MSAALVAARYHFAMVRARIRAAALAIVAAAGLVAVAPPGVAHANLCRVGVPPSVRFGPGGCINPAYRAGGGGGGAPAQSGNSSWPPTGGNTWPPRGGNTWPPGG